MSQADRSQAFAPPAFGLFGSDNRVAALHGQDDADRLLAGRACRLPPMAAKVPGGPQQRDLALGLEQAVVG